jgi:hypothetical protein
VSTQPRHRFVIALAIVLIVLILVPVAAVGIRFKVMRDRDRARVAAIASAVASDLKAARNDLDAKDPPDIDAAINRLASAAHLLEEARTIAPRLDSQEDQDGMERLEHAGRAVKAELERARQWSADEQAFTTAVDVVQKRAVSRYGEALASLASIGSSSRLHGDAQLYSRWLRADQAVRAADAARKQGDRATARQLLLEAMAVTELGPEAKASIQRRLDQLDIDEKK